MTSGHTFTGFLSYAHIDAQADPKLVEALTTTLETRVHARLAVGEFTIWRDTDRLRTGDRWDPKIEAALRASDVLILLVTPRWIGSDYCRKEFAIFEEGELDLGEGAFIAPLLGRSVADEELYLTPEQKNIWDRLKARQFRSLSAGEFLKLKDDERTALVDKLADDLKLMIDRRRSKLASAMPGAVAASPAHLEQIQRELSKAKEEADRRHREMLAAIAKEKGVPREQLEPILTALGYENVPLDQIAERLREAVHLSGRPRPWLSVEVEVTDGINGVQSGRAYFTARVTIRNFGSAPALRVLLSIHAYSHRDGITSEMQSKAISELADPSRAGPTVFPGPDQVLVMDCRLEFDVVGLSPGETSFMPVIPGCIGYNSPVSDFQHQTSFTFFIVRWRPPNKNAMVFFAEDGNVPAGLIGTHRSLFGNDLAS